MNLSTKTLSLCTFIILNKSKNKREIENQLSTRERNLSEVMIEKLSI